MASSTGGYSARVALTLIVNGLTLGVSHVGHTGLIVTELHDPIPAGSEGKLVVSIDGKKRQKKIFLPSGIPSPGQFAPFF